jgi:hypothetical protein
MTSHYGAGEWPLRTDLRYGRAELRWRVALSVCLSFRWSWGEAPCRATPRRPGAARPGSCAPRSDGDSFGAAAVRQIEPLVFRRTAVWPDVRENSVQGAGGRHAPSFAAGFTDDDRRVSGTHDAKVSRTCALAQAQSAPAVVLAYVADAGFILSRHLSP